MSMTKVLIIDDEKNIRMTIKNCLDESKYEVEVAVNGEDGFEKLSQNNYDLALMDIKMPGISGLELLKKIRENQIKTDVVMMTAYGTIDRAVEAMKLGAIDFLSKPFTPEEIRTVVEQVTSRKELKEDKLDSFNDLMEFSKYCIINHEYDKAIEYLKKAIALDVDSPEPHNLLGVLDEMNRDIRAAQKHYRAALALDPSHVAANKNLSRTTEYHYSMKGLDMGLNGLKTEGDDQENGSK